MLPGRMSINVWHDLKNNDQKNHQIEKMNNINL